MTANISKQTRKAIYRRDGFRCALCDSTRYLQIHHVIPRGQGGPRENPHNMITLCADCHALAHGVDLRGVQDMNDGMMEQAIVEYLADLYAEQGIIWNPWARPRKPRPWLEEEDENPEPYPRTRAQEADLVEDDLVYEQTAMDDGPP